MILTASILTMHVTWQGKNIKFPDDETEMSKHVAVYIIYRDTLRVF
jgi:hypothetical protein